MATTLTKPKTAEQASLDGRFELIALGERIKSLRSARSLSQEALSRAVGISRPTLSKIERGVEDVGTT